jgi:hypothetical protein
MFPSRTKRTDTTLAGGQTTNGNSALLALPSESAGSHEEFPLAQKNHQGIVKRASNASGVLKHVLHDAQRRGNRPCPAGKTDHPPNSNQKGKSAIFNSEPDVNRSTTWCTQRHHS